MKILLMIVLIVLVFLIGALLGTVAVCVTLDFATLLIAKQGLYMAKKDPEEEWTTDDINRVRANLYDNLSGAMFDTLGLYTQYADEYNFEGFKRNFWK